MSKKVIYQLVGIIVMNRFCITTLKKNIRIIPQVIFVYQKYLIYQQ